MIILTVDWSLLSIKKVYIIQGCFLCMMNSYSTTAMRSCYSTFTHGLCPQMQTSAISGYHAIFNQWFATPMCKTDIIMSMLSTITFKQWCRALVEAITRNVVVTCEELNRIWLDPIQYIQWALTRVHRHRKQCGSVEAMLCRAKCCQKMLSQCRISPRVVLQQIFHKCAPLDYKIKLFFKGI